MEYNFNKYNTFQTTLECGNFRKPLIYEKNTETSVPGNVERQYSSRDVLSNINKQLDALQTADGTKNTYSRNNLLSYKRSTFTPVNLLSLENNQPGCSHAIHKFETQCVLDTQLINLIEDAEKVDPSKGITQEFENSFCEQHIELKQDMVTKNKCLDVNVSNKSEGPDFRLISPSLDFSRAINCHKKFKEENMCESNRKEKRLKVNEVINIAENDLDISQSNITTSPVIDYIKPLTLENSLSPLIYTLDAFENFETLAFSIVTNNPDLEAAKYIINSQIIDKELCLGGHTKSVDNKVERSLSPVLNIRQKRRHSSNSPKPVIDKIKKVSLKVPDKVLFANNAQSIDTEIGKYFEDEILFSSDEEDSKIVNQQDLPLTCALETSFYNQHNILETTMYVGFQTASNKSIQISAESFSKAQSVLEDLGTEACQPTLTELVMMFDKKNNFPCNDNKLEISTSNDQSKQDCSNENIECPELDTKLKPILKGTMTMKEDLMHTEGEIMAALSIDNKDDILNNLKKSEKNLLNKNYVPVFQTASNKKIKLSENALAKCQQVFKDIDLDDKLDKTLPEDEVNELVQNPSFVQGEDEAKSVCVKLNLPVLSSNTTKIHKQKEKSDEIQLDDQNIIQEFENDLLDSDIEKKEIESTNLNSNGNNKLLKCELTPNSVEKKSCLNDFDNYLPPFVGFKTASNKHINISECAIMKTKFIMDDFNLSQNFEKEGEIGETTEKYIFEDNSQKFLKSKLELTKPSNAQISEKQNNKSCQFKTANNMPVTITSEALDKIEKLSKDIETHISNNPIEYGNNEKNNDYQGFKTANNKAITVSNSALLKMNNFFKDILSGDVDGNQNFTVKKENDNLYSDSKEVPQTSENDGNISNKEPNTNINDKALQNKNLQTFEGFRTASNKNVKTSDEALAKSKNLFLDLEFYKDDKQFEAQNLPNEDFKGFQTANNKQIKVSRESLAKSKLLFQDLQFEDNNENIRLNTTKAAIDPPFNQIKESTINEENINSKLGSPQKNLFIGFQTASKKQVKVSDQALAMSKKILQDLELQDIVKSNKNNNGNNIKVKSIVTLKHESQKTENLKHNLLFKTGNNKHVQVTKKSLVESKKILDLNSNDEVLTSSHIPKQMEINGENNINVENLFDSEVLNNFEMTMYTEDFCSDTKHDRSKRSGSPILLCPRAKKRKKFEVPCKKTGIPTQQKTEKAISQPIIPKPFTFDDNYKRSKKYVLKDLGYMEKRNPIEHVVDPYILNFKYETSLHFEFSEERNEFSDKTWTTGDLKNYFVSQVNSKLIPDGWLDNHLRLIIFKLISYETLFKGTMSGVCTAKNVLQQLKYRYDRELYNVERPAIRKLLEKDDVPAKTMILRVAEIYVDGTAMIGETSSCNVELLLSDGWYSIKACLDQMLVKLVKEKKITVGTKLAIHGAEMVNCDQGLAPWEDTSRVRLKIFGNSTRRARWDARLGHFPAGAILTPLSRVQMDGGKVSKMRAFVTRVYPTVYVEKFDDGSTVTRSERLEHLFQVKYESERQELLEKIYEEVEKEFTNQESQDSECDTQSRSSMESGSQINRLLLQSKDSAEFRANLTSSQCRLLQDYSSRRREKLLQAVQTRIEERLKSKGLHVGRNVVPVMKIRLADVSGNGDISKAMMSIWRPNDAVQDIIKEGIWIDMFNIVPTAMRFSEIQFSAGRQAVFNRSKYKENAKIQHIISRLKRTCYSIRDLVQNPAMNTECNEVDTSGLVFLIEPSNAQFESIKGQLFQNVYLADKEKNIICVNFWGGLKKFGYENVLDTGQVLACMNLQKRAGNTRKSIPQFRATELSYFSKVPKIEDVRKFVDDLNRTLSRVNVKKFCEECISKKNSYSVLKYGNGENISPYRMNYSDYNISKHKSYIHSPSPRKTNSDDILNLSGLDFESTFKQTDTQDMSPSAILRKKKVNEKIARLKMYGEPPPITPIHIINKSNNATSAFKNPLTSNFSNVAKEKQQIFSTHHNSSPVICSKNSAKINSGNPVKLNFSNNISKEDSSESKIDPFAEEFDASPPLSLD